MSIFVENTKVSKVFVGNTEVKRVFVGNDLIWPTNIIYWDEAPADNVSDWTAVQSVTITDEVDSIRFTATTASPAAVAELSLTGLTEGNHYKMELSTHDSSINSHQVALTSGAFPALSANWSDNTDQEVDFRGLATSATLRYSGVFFSAGQFYEMEALKVTEYENTSDVYTDVDEADWTEVGTFFDMTNIAGGRMRVRNTIGSSASGTLDSQTVTGGQKYFFGILIEGQDDTGSDLVLDIEDNIGNLDSISFKDVSDGWVGGYYSTNPSATTAFMKIDVQGRTCDFNVEAVEIVEIA